MSVLSARGVPQVRQSTGESPRGGGSTEGRGVPEEQSESQARGQGENWWFYLSFMVRSVPLVLFLAGTTSIVSALDGRLCLANLIADQM